MDFHPVANIFPMMSTEEFDGLKADIAANGQRESIWTYQGKIIDGRNRYQACKAVGIDPKFREWSGQGSLVQFAVSLNLNRRHLTSSQKAVVALEIEKLLAEEAKERQRIAGHQTNAKTSVSDSKQRAALKQKIAEAEKGQAREKAAAIVGTNRQYVSDAKQIAVKAPDLLQKVRNGSATIPEVKREIKERERTQQRIQAVNTGLQSPASTDRYSLRCGDLSVEMDKLKADSVDVIITDPPYPREYLSLYTILAEKAVRILKPGALCIVMCGQSYLPEIYEMLSRCLTYHWTAAYLTPGGQAVQLFPRKVNTFWKPLLIYSKGKYDGKWFGDVTKSSVNDNDKEHHNWGQSVSGMLDVVSRFSEQDQNILDPFCGAGTTGIACLHLGRRFIGIDSDEKTIAIAKGRLANARS